MSQTDMNQYNIIAGILNERGFQDRQWGVQNHSDMRWLPILMEEVGEVARAMLHQDGDESGEVGPELVQVAAVALAWLEAIERRA